jgi:hypothetical protein
MEYLFNAEPLSEFLDRYKINLTREIESYDSEKIFGVNQKELIDYLIAKHTIEIPHILENKIVITDKKDVRKDGNERPILANASMLTGRISLTVTIPFEGITQLFRTKPSTYYPIPPIGELQKSEILLHFKGISRDSKLVRKEYNKVLADIKSYLAWMKNDVDSHNEWIKNNVEKLVINRKKDLSRDEDFLKAIGLPIKRADKTLEPYYNPIKREKIRLKKPDMRTISEPVLPQSEYEHILEIISHMSLAMERSPKTFSKLIEPEIRDFFIIILNSHYEGQVSGETFNFQGQTDILIRVNEKNIFIAECKFWDGKEEFLRTIDQILSYLSWRDTKTAIVLFSKRKNFGNILTKIDETTQSHSLFKYCMNFQSKDLETETNFSYVFKHPTDENRQLFLSILAFNIPKD